MKNAKNYSRKELNAVINAYVIGAIDCSNYTVTGTCIQGNLIEMPVICETDHAKVNFVMNCFKDEYLHHNNRNGNPVTLFTEWLQGLPSSFNVDYENYRIIEIAKEWGSLQPDATERQEYAIINNWFNYIANKFFTLHKSLNRPVKATA